MNAESVVELFQTILWIVLYLGLLALITVGLPLAALTFLHMRRPARTETAIDDAAKVVVQPTHNAAGVLDSWSRRLSAGRTAVSDTARQGRPAVWVVLLAPVGALLLLTATWLGVDTELATLASTNNPDQVRYWLTFAVFCTGFVGGTLLLEGLGVTHFFRRATPEPSALDTGQGDTHDTRGEGTTEGRTTSRARRLLNDRFTPGSLVLCVVALVLLTMPAYAVVSGATRRAQASVEAQSEDLSRRGVACSTTGISIGAPQAGGAPVPPAKARAECLTVLNNQFQNKNWGIAGAIGMIFLDVVLGWTIPVTLALTVALAVGALQLLTAAGRGTARALTLGFTRLHALTISLVRTVGAALRRGPEPDVVLQPDTPTDPARGPDPTEPTEPIDLRPRPSGHGTRARQTIPPESRTSPANSHTDPAASPADIWV